MNQDKKQCSRCLVHRCSVEDFRKSGGNVCNHCIKIASKAFYEANKERQKIYREAKKAKTPPKPKKPKKTKEELEASIKRRSHKYKLKLQARKIKENLANRIPKKTPDREIYISNDVWGIDNFRFHANWDYIMNNSVEQLEYILSNK